MLVKYKPLNIPLSTMDPHNLFSLYLLQVPKPPFRLANLDFDVVQLFFSRQKERTEDEKTL